MTVRPIRLFGDPVLRTPADPVVDFDARVRRLVADLEDTVREPGRAGVAAPQIGVSLRVFAYHVDGVVGHLVNPVLSEFAGTQDDEEGCLSLPGLAFPPRGRCRWWRPDRTPPARRCGSRAPGCSPGRCSTRPITWTGACSSTR
jgi:peptide deformylase